MTEENTDYQSHNIMTMLWSLIMTPLRWIYNFFFINIVSNLEETANGEEVIKEILSAQQETQEEIIHDPSNPSEV